MSDVPVSVAVIVGSTRPNRHSEPVARWIQERAALHLDLTADLVDLAQVDLPIYDEPAPPIMGNYSHEHTKAWAATIAGWPTCPAGYDRCSVPCATTASSR